MGMGIHVTELVSILQCAVDTTAFWGCCQGQAKQVVRNRLIALGTDCGSSLVGLHPRRMACFQPPAALCKAKNCLHRT
jgi:hypothetical protein